MSQTSPSVSVVIPCFNHGEFLPEAAASVTALERRDVELIVVDDGSSDERTPQEVEALAARGIHTIRQKNQGLAAARNAGIQASQGKYILPLDADNRLRPGYVEQGIRILDAHPQVGVVYGDAQCFGTETGRWRMGEFDRARLLKENYIDACAMFRRPIWEQNGGYDGAMPVQGYEDWDFWLGAVEHGWAFAYIPEVLFEYRKSAESMFTRAKPCQVQIEDFVARKHGPLYRSAWLQLAGERESLRQALSRQDSLGWTLRNLGRLVTSRGGRKSPKTAGRGGRDGEMEVAKP